MKMKIELKRISIRKMIIGYKDSAEKGVVAYGGKLDIRPEYQREFVYKDKQRDAVIETINKGFPLNIMYWVIRDGGSYEVLDGQQRTISIGQYINGDFSLNNYFFNNLSDTQRDKILDYELMIYFCKGTAEERKAWFTTINIAGEKLTPQEILNSCYTGPWLSNAKLKFSKTGCAAYLLANNGGQLVSGEPIRQKYLETTISWISAGEIKDYMAKHQHDKNADELWNYFQKVIEWVRKIFPNYRYEMKNVPWGELYNQFKNGKHDSKKLEKEISKLMENNAVTNKPGIYEYVLTRIEKVLSIRAFEDNDKREVYEKQKGICPLCKDKNKKKKWEIGEMEADHINPWRNGGKTIQKNCRMLCKECHKDRHLGV